MMIVTCYFIRHLHVYKAQKPGNNIGTKTDKRPWYVDVITALIVILSNVIFQLTARSSRDNLHAVQLCQGNLTLAWLTRDDGVHSVTQQKNLL